MAYENETLQECCKRVVKKLKSKCEKIDEQDKNCLQRQDEFEERCDICQAAGLLCYLDEEAETIQNAARNARQRELDRSFIMNSVGN